ncbi:MAG TPA: hypothetical protein VLF21_00595 [Candidatus Saccharimonadales bacterium]|nr:hypothetical protein [Candidatus Saccharimonadales bacterium]
MNFLKQAEEPLFPDILWNRPLVKNRGGRLLALGGHSRGFAAIQAVFQLAEAAGIGECLIGIPDSLAKLVGDAPEIMGLPASPSGSLGKAALGEVLHTVADCDGLLVGLDLTNNSETAVLVESVLQKAEKPIMMTEEALDTLPGSAQVITENAEAVLIGSMNAIIAVANRNKLALQLRPEKQLIGRIEAVQQIADAAKCALVIIGREIIVCADGQTSITPQRGDASDHPAVQAVFAPFWLQNKSKRFEALTTAAFVLSKSLPADQDLTYGQIAGSIRTALQHFS